ncbi:unnamed protein product [Staurois parvus]|uniref:Uncharacterized protein n=1 Tax=Staurois parvus TaxID=386267 RepID=A0ABN9FI07_9NEOB|nr:unnamed protein product [Staurois parvus]
MSLSESPLTPGVPIRVPLTSGISIKVAPYIRCPHQSASLHQVSPSECPLTSGSPSEQLSPSEFPLTSGIPIRVPPYIRVPP